MHIQQEQLNPTTVKLSIEVDASALMESKQETLKRLGKQMKIAGFRPGKAPMAIIERHADPNTLQTEVLDHAMNRAYGQALDQENIRPVDQPKVALTKYVPFTTLTFTAEVPTIGKITLPDYAKLRLAKPTVTIDEKDIDEVIHNLQNRAAERNIVTRAAQDGDEVLINFKGVDAKTDEAVRGAEGKDYPLQLGSNTFIPGFETNLIGLKAGEEKTFTLTFPSEYGVKALQNRDVAFTVTVTKVEEVVLPKADDAFAAKAGAFKTLEALRADIQKHLQAEKQAEAERAYQNELVDKLAEKTTVAIPDVLINEEVQRLENEARRNITYRGQTWKEYLEELDQDEEAYQTSLRAPAEVRVRAGLALSEVAEREGITIAPEELDVRMKLLKGQYTDAAMRAELEKPANVRSVMSTMLAEKTVARLAELISATPTKKKS